MTNSSDLHKAHSAAHEKYHYFLLAAAGAAIGFALHKTEEEVISWWLLPVALASLLWALSFYFGCLAIGSVNTAMGANYNYLVLYDNYDKARPVIPQGKLESRLLAEREKIRNNQENAFKYARLQFHLLALGAVFFIVWHVLEMWCRTNPCT